MTLNLTDPLPRDAEFITDLQQRVPLAVNHAGAHPQHMRGLVFQVEKLGLTEDVQRREWQGVSNRAQRKVVVLYSSALL